MCLFNFVPTQRVDYCLIQPIPERYRLRISPMILTVVIVVNFIKALCILFTLMDYTPAFLTIRDSVESFLISPNRATQGLCRLNRDHIRENAKYKGRWRKRIYRRYQAGSRL